MEEKLSTKNWMVGIAISSLIATFLMGYLHEAGILDERVSPLIHTLRDWMIVVVPMVPIAYVVAKMMPSGNTSQMIKCKRVYEPPSDDDGRRILVDRLWPRGLTREQAKIDLWLKDIAPSDALREWFGHDPAKWDEFKNRYFQELKDKKEAVGAIKEKIKEGAVTFVYGAKDAEHNNAQALKEYLSGDRSSL